jgi:pseudaminic acid cytidylyltransferase
VNIAIIPARGGSKRIPRKNIKDFCGKPIIAYSIEAAIKCGLFSSVIVSTDDLEIANIAKERGAEVPFMRPAELADDHTGTVSVIAHAIKASIEKDRIIKTVCCIYPAAPMIEIGDLVAAHLMLKQQNTNYVLPIAAFPSAIQRALRQKNDGYVEPFYPEYVKNRTQDVEAAYFDAGQFYFGKTEAWLSGQSPHSNAKGLLIPEGRVVDIDTPEDWEKAEAIFNYLKSIEVSRS